MIKAILLAAGQSKRLGAENKLLKLYKSLIVGTLVGNLVKSQIVSLNLSIVVHQVCR